MRQRRRNGFWPLAFSVLWSSLVATGSALGVVIDTGDGSGNTTAPDDDPGFANVGRLFAGSAVYLGNRWVLTASHVGPGPVTFGDQSFGNLVDHSFRLENPPTVQDELSKNTDLLLLRLAEDPGLPPLRLGCEPVQNGSQVLMIGYGRDREEALSFWTVEEKLGDDNDEWTLVDSGEAYDEAGYTTKNHRTKRWGWNQVILSDTDAESGSGDVLSFQTVFHPVINVPDVAQGVRGDSGGAVFQKNHGVWELVGLLHAITLEDNQPGLTNTAIYGNETFSADLFRYADMMRAIADFEPMPGDLDADGQYTAFDIDQMLHAQRDPANDSCHFDLNGSQAVDSEDLDQLLTLAESLIGDANLDGMVDFDDYLALSRAFGQFDAGWAGGDFDGDGETTFDDFLILTRSFGDSFEAQLTSSTSRRRIVEQAYSPLAAAVPEPNSALLLLAGSLFALAAIRRRQVELPLLERPTIYRGCVFVKSRVEKNRRVRMCLSDSL